ncbi:unnamed protein product [Ilex paraguariensis]|uniref:Uncharacterized protein n=1 Tax=Ilex paraguariensis TaxID=185542 RepID=A0ABC8R802_9AQUA
MSLTNDERRVATEKEERGMLVGQPWMGPVCEARSPYVEVEDGGAGREGETWSYICSPALFFWTKYATTSFSWHSNLINYERNKGAYKESILYIGQDLARSIKFNHLTYRLSA